MNFKQIVESVLEEGYRDDAANVVAKNWRLRKRLPRVTKHAGLVTPEDIEATGLTDMYRESGVENAIAPEEYVWGAGIDDRVTILFNVKTQYIIADPATGGDEGMGFSVKGLTIPQIRKQLKKCIQNAIADIGDYRNFFS